MCFTKNIDENLFLKASQEQCTFFTKNPDEASLYFVF